EHRPEESAEAAQPADVEVLEIDRLRLSAPRARSASRPRATKTPEPAVKCTEPTHLVVLLPLLRIAEDVVGLRDLLESLRRLGIALVRVRVVLLGELAVRLLDLVLGSAGAYAEYGVEVLRLWHGRS